MWDKLQSFCHPITTKLPKKNNRIYPQRRFTSHVTEYTSHLRGIFYPQGVKIVPKKEMYSLTALGLTVWYMDDGGICWYKTEGREQPLARIYSMGFSPEDHALLLAYFSDVWEIEAYLRKSNAGTKQFLAFDAPNTKKLFSLIAPYFCECMSYKVVRHEQNDQSVKI